MEKKGWFRVYRTAFSEDDRLWSEKRERTKWEAWMDLINMAAFKDHEVLYDGSLITVERGQVPTSERNLAARWEWSRGKIRRFLTLRLACIYHQSLDFVVNQASALIDSSVIEESCFAKCREHGCRYRLRNPLARSDGDLLMDGTGALTNWSYCRPPDRQWTGLQRPILSSARRLSSHA